MESHHKNDMFLRIRSSYEGNNEEKSMGSLDTANGLVETCKNNNSKEIKGGTPAMI